VSTTGLLGDTPERDYSRKLQTFNRFAAPELRQAIASLQLRPGMRVLDAGCGTGEALHWLGDAVSPGGKIVGVDLAEAHLAAARSIAPAGAEVLLCDLSEIGLPPSSFDLIWCVNTLNHFHDPSAVLRKLARLLRPQGRIALGQSSLLPDMFCAWDSRLERLVNEGVRAYYRERYGLDEQRLTAVRRLVGQLRSAGFHEVHPRTFVIERVSPLDEPSRRYLFETFFRDTWGERLRPYLDSADDRTLRELCDPESRHFALDRPDFHFIQTFTLVTGEPQ
jgi:ubiquinone/menaquinone biosynthesis C-methylase UbiE